jgi:hypothetical protein
MSGYTSLAGISRFKCLVGFLIIGIRLGFLLGHFVIGVFLIRENAPHVEARDLTTML